MSAMAQLRRTIFQKRRHLTLRQRRLAGRATTHLLLRHPLIKRSQHIGIYLDAFGEVPTRLLLTQLLKLNKSVYLPVVIRTHTALQWRPIGHFSCLSRLVHHPLGMLQPMWSRAYPVNRLDCLIMPLVAFDDLGHRVGMGGGYYDRTLAIEPHRVHRIGLAYEFQKVATTLSTQPWDQALDAVVTPQQIYTFKRV